MKQTLLSLGIIAALTALPSLAHAHCDTMDGPVVIDARQAISKKDIAPVLKWIGPKHEDELKAAFAQALIVRTVSEAAEKLADQYFFETLVRLHRQGEDAPYTGIKPAGTGAEPIVKATDHALESGKIDPVLKEISESSLSGIRARFADALEKKAHAEHNVGAGRAYVASYVELVHHIEALHTTASRAAGTNEHAH